MKCTIVLLFLGIAAISAAPRSDDVAVTPRYDANIQNAYHLFTRQNPSLSQPLLPGNTGILYGSNFSPLRRTIFLIHGWNNYVLSDFNLVLIPAFLGAEDVNVIVVDWSAGAGGDYLHALDNTPESGEAVARFISWLLSLGVSIDSLHIVGHSLGGHQAGIVGRHLGGEVPYITAIDPSFSNWISNPHKFRPTDALYTEVIHTNSGVMGYLTPTGDVDFYPNGGSRMPGCSTDECDHARGYWYFAESLTSGGFIGRRCYSHVTAIAQTCGFLPITLHMGGLTPKTGSRGIYSLDTNAFPPFSLQ